MDDNASKNMSVAAYILPFGWIYAFFATDICNLRNPLTVFHLRQGLGLNILLVMGWIATRLADIWILTQIFWIIILIYMIRGIIGARKGEKNAQKPLGNIFHNMFTFIR